MKHPTSTIRIETVNHLTPESWLKKQILNRIACPIIVILLTLTLSVVIKQTVLKNFSDIFAFNNWPDSDKFLFYFASFVEHWWWLILFSLLFTAWLFYQFSSLFTKNFREEHVKLILTCVATVLTLAATGIIATIVLGTYDFTRIS